MGILLLEMDIDYLTSNEEVTHMGNIKMEMSQ